MRIVLQRVESCSVTVDGKISGKINRGLLVYLGVEQEDTEKDVEYLAEKVSSLRIYPDDNGKMNLSVVDIQGDILVVSQFTLCADVRKGRRPSYSDAAAPETGNALYLKFIESLKRRDIHTEAGIFGAMMDVAYINKGPVTILLDSRKIF